MNAPLHYDTLATADNGADLLEVCLVDGSDDMQVSRECALQIILDLQNYYRRRNLSHQERFGSTDPAAEKVMAQLARAYEGARQWNGDAGDSSLTLSLGSSFTQLSVPR